MIKINKNSVTIAAYKKAVSYINKLSSYICSNVLAGIIVSFICLGLYIASAGAYGTHNKDLASILLLTYIVIISGCCISRLYNGMVAALVFAIPIFACICTISSSPESKLNKCVKVEKRLQQDTDGTEYLQHWYKHNCGGN